jgi:hypothetical protein
VFGRTEGVTYSFHVLLLNSFSTVLRAHDPVFMFYALEFVLGGTENAENNFTLLH